MTTFTCVLRPYGQQMDYVPLEHCRGLVPGEPTYTGQFIRRPQTIPGPFSKGVAASQRNVLVPVGELSEGTVTDELTARYGVVDAARSVPYQYCRPV